MTRGEIEDLLRELDKGLHNLRQMYVAGPYGVWVEEKTIHEIADALRVEMKNRAQEEEDNG